MRMLMDVLIPHDQFNEAVRDGSAGPRLREILDELKAEAVYFTERDGCRAVTLIVEMDDASRVPFFAEPWFLSFEADVEFRVVMSPEELARAGLDELGDKWA